MTGNRHMFSSADNDIVGHIPEQPTQSNIELIVLVGLQFSCEDQQISKTNPFLKIPLSSHIKGLKDRVWCAVPSILFLHHGPLPPFGSRRQFPHFREQDGRTYEEGSAEFTHIMPFKWIFQELLLDAFSYSLEPELHPLVYLAAREAKNCSPKAIWLYALLKITKFYVITMERGKGGHWRWPVVSATLI